MLINRGCDPFVKNNVRIEILYPEVFIFFHFVFYFLYVTIFNHNIYNFNNKCGSTPLFNVVYYGHDEVCESMLSLYQEKFGFAKTLDFINSQDNEDKTALMYGAMEGKKSFNCVMILLKWNADTEILDCHGWNAFTYASYHGNFDTCQELLAKSKNHDDPSASEELVFNINNGMNIYISNYSIILIIFFIYYE